MNARSGEHDLFFLHIIINRRFETGADLAPEDGTDG